MSKPNVTPHIVKVYHYEGEGEQMRLVLKVTERFPSKCQAEAFASQQRRFNFVSSAVVTPAETYQGMPIVADDTMTVCYDGGGA